MGHPPLNHPAVEQITITVKLFAIYQEAYGQPELQWTFPAHTPIEEVLNRVLVEHPHLEPWRERTRLGLNLQFVSPDTLLEDGDEVVLIPPVSGG
ncbi:MAG: MoaD/ThiS family protein [Leptolyngbyaceae cyanobacterium SM2_5_2]|nr:MoaD/ThiS family protein [Leptolyngbyaceae cyanobacterium SM2_5_2]